MYRRQKNCWRSLRYGRTIIFNPETGGLTIRAVGQPEIVI